MNFKTSCGSIILIGIIILLTAGCIQVSDNSDYSGTGYNTDISNSSDSLIITDALGNRVVFDNQPRRIISQNGRILPLIIAFGAGDRVVGVPDNVIEDDILMPDLPNAENVGNWQTLNTEKILSLNSDVLIAYTNWKPKNIDQITTQNLTVIYLDCYHVSRLPNESRTLGKIIGEEANAEAYAQNIEYYLSLIRDRVDQASYNQTPIRAYAELYKDFQVMGNGSMGEEILNMYKIDNIAHEVYLNPIINNEWVVEQNPDVIIKIASASNDDYPNLKAIHDKITQRTGFSDLSAVKNNRVYVINTEAFSGARSVAGTLYLAKAFYPDYFSDIDPVEVFNSYNGTFKPLIDSDELFYPAIP